MLTPGERVLTVRDTRAVQSGQIVIAARSTREGRTPGARPISGSDGSLVGIPAGADSFARFATGGIVGDVPKIQASIMEFARGGVVVPPSLRGFASGGIAKAGDVTVSAFAEGGSVRQDSADERQWWPPDASSRPTPAAEMIARFASGGAAVALPQFFDATVSDKLRQSDRGITPAIPSPTEYAAEGAVITRGPAHMIAGEAWPEESRPPSGAPARRVAKAMGLKGSEAQGVALTLNVHGDNWREGGIADELLEKIHDGLNSLIRRGRKPSFVLRTA